MTEREPATIIGVVVCPKQRPAIPVNVGLELPSLPTVTVRGLPLIEGRNERLFGTIVDLERVVGRTTPASLLGGRRHAGALRFSAPPNERP